MSLATIQTRKREKMTKTGTLVVIDPTDDFMKFIKSQEYKYEIAFYESDPDIIRRLVIYSYKLGSYLKEIIGSNMMFNEE